MGRIEDLKHFYSLLEELEKAVGGKRLLANCDADRDWPCRGVYFFFEEGELRSNSSQLRVVRVGTHALKPGSQSTLWQRLHAHQSRLKGPHVGGGNHRGSVFRKHLGTAILRRDRLAEKWPHWGKGSSAELSIRDAEHPIEQKVSNYIRLMPFLWLEVPDPPGPGSLRGYIERNAIALLSNYEKLGTPDSIDPPSPAWLGRFCASDAICKSGLWNVEHAKQHKWNPLFLEALEQFTEQM